MRNNFLTSNRKEKDKDGGDDDIINYGFPVDLSLLTDRQRKIVERTRRDFLSKFLKDQGLLEEENYEDKSNATGNNVERVIKDMEFLLKHTKRIKKIEYNLLTLISSYRNENDPHKREIISGHIIAVKYYLSAYYLAVMAKSDEIHKK